jgi:hypothetical protein
MRALLPTRIIVDDLDLTSKSGALVDAPGFISGAESLVNGVWDVVNLRGGLSPGQGSLEHPRAGLEGHMTTYQRE